LESKKSNILLFRMEGVTNNRNFKWLLGTKKFNSNNDNTFITFIPSHGI